MLKSVVRELLPPIITKSIRRLRADPRATAEARELQRLASSAGPQVTNIIGWPFHVTSGPDFAALYGTFFQGRVYDFPCGTGHPFIIDCGAHVGVSVAWWKTRYPEARVLAFEADATNFALLKQNCGHLPDVTLVYAAVWTLDGEAMFAAKGGEGGHLAALSAEVHPSAVKVPCVRLRPYLGEPCDLLKMDIEGAEIDVLRDCADQLGQVDRIFAEYHSFVGRHQLLGQTISVLEDAGFRLHAHVAGVSPRPFTELRVFNEKDLRLELFAFRESPPHQHGAVEPG